MIFNIDFVVIAVAGDLPVPKAILGRKGSRDLRDQWGLAFSRLILML